MSKRCRRDDCALKAHAEGLCWRHVIEVREARGDHCSADDCSSGRFYRGMCPTHAVAASRAEHDPDRTKQRGYQARYRAKRPEPVRRSDSFRSMRRRAAVAVAEPFDPMEVFDRDGWVCGICRDPVDRSLAYPDPLSVSLDHVIPLADGGEHTRANTRCAHLRCNVRRGARVGEEQLRLVG